MQPRIARPDGPGQGASPLDVEALYRESVPSVRRWILRFYGASEAEEVVQEIFVKVLEAASAFRQDASPTTWLYRLTTNHCINRLRNEGRRRELWRENAELLWGASDVPADQESLAYLRARWRQLPPDLVQIGVYYFVEGLTHAAIAELVGCSPRTVGNQLVRLRELAVESEPPKKARSAWRPSTWFAGRTQGSQTKVQ